MALRSVQFFLVADPADQESVDAIERRLRASGLEVGTSVHGQSGPDTERELASGIDNSVAVAIAVGSTGVTLHLDMAIRFAGQASPPRPVFAVVLPGAIDEEVAGIPVAPERRIDLRTSVTDDEQLDRLRSLVVLAGEGNYSAPAGPESELDQLDSLFGRLDESSRAALAEAEGMRIAAHASEVHMEHLLAGMYAANPGPARAAVDARMTEADFNQILVDAAPSGLPDASTFQLASLEGMPILSKHVRTAMLEAGRIADSTQSTTIESRHLFYGAMSVETCSPIKELLRREVSKDVALAWTPPSRLEPTDDGPLTVEASAKTDQPTDRDLIGYKGLVDALASLLMGHNTTFPLTIAISAPWGAGKSSVMRQLIARLNEAPAASRWVVVQFPAWAYETGDQLWAAMAKQTYQAALNAQEGWIDKQRFRFRLEWRRRNVGLEVARALLIIAGAIAGAIGGFVFAQLIGVPAEGGAAAVGGVGGLIGVARAISGDVADPFKRAVESFTQRIGVQRGDGFTPDAAASVNALMDALLEKGGRLAIFIDDLDRCAPRNLVRVIEATNQIFVAGSDIANRPDHVARASYGNAPETEPRRLVFVMGMDRQVVARGIETEYAALMARLEKAKDPAFENYGLSFLDKIIQLWVTLPAPERSALETLLRNVAGLDRTVPEGGVDADHATALPTGRGTSRGVGDAGVDRRSGPTGGADVSTPNTAPGRPVDVTAPSVDDDPMVWEAMLVGARCLEANPRQVKRFNNAFRLQLYLVTAARKTLSVEELGALSKWVAIRLRWGALAYAMDEEPDLLWSLEQVANNARLRGARLARLDRQKDRTPQWFLPKAFADQSDFYEALKQPSGARISDLPFDDFLRVV